MEEEVREEEPGTNDNEQVRNEEDTCLGQVQESIVNMEETTLAEIHAELMTDKKKKKKWRRVFKKKAKKVQKMPQENTNTQEDNITTIGHSSEQTQPDIDSPQQKKTSRWSRCKKFFRNISKNKKGMKCRYPSNDISTNQSLEISDGMDNENHSTGLFMCWRRRRSNNKRNTTSSSDSCDESESANVGSDPRTRTDSVVYISSSKQKITMTRPQDIPEDIPEEFQEDAISLASVALSDSSSLDILSLLEGDNSDCNNTSPARKPLDTKEEIDKMDSVSKHDLHSVQCVKVLSQKSEISHLKAIDLNVANKTKITDITYSESKTITKT